LPNGPSDTFETPGWARSKPLLPAAEPGSIGARQCDRRSLARGAFHLRRPLTGAPFEVPVQWRAALVGQREQPPPVFIEVRKPRLDRLPRVAFRERLAGRGRCCGFCKCLFPRARPRTTRTSRTTELMVGTTAARCRVASPSRRPPEVRRARGREKPISTLPTMIAHGGDFAPTPIAPGTSCREHRPSPCPERRGGESGFAAATTACTAAATRGSCDARLPRRNPTFTNPRGLPLRDRR
jgi:hypothetical protein